MNQQLGSDEVPPEKVEPEMTPEEFRGWAEYCCWVSTILTPILIWWNGPSVSDDQAVVRTGLVVISIVGAVGLRLYAIILKRRKSRQS